MSGALDDIEAGDTIVSDRVTPDTLDLFMYSAATWITHRTHFEREFALGEGHAGVLVHGPLQGAYVIERLHDWAAARGGRLVSLDFRHLSPAVAGTELEVSARLREQIPAPGGNSVLLDIALDKVGEGPCLAGTAIVEIPIAKAG